MKNAPGYPLPDGELGEDELVCQLVYLPDRPEYWQAFLSAYHYMTTWRAWERDTEKRGRDAAANWRAAFELTIGCWRMTCLQDLQDNVADILAIMQLGQSCCDDQDITDGDRYTDRVTDGVGDVPQNVIDAGYASGVGDWAGFDDYKCMIVHVTVNQMQERLFEISLVLNEFGMVFGGVVALAGVLGVIFATGGVAIVFGLIAGIGTLSSLYNALMGFGPVEDLVDKIATNHDDLACAMYFADGDVAALVALNTKIDLLFTVPEAVILKNMNNGPTLKALYAGRYDQQDIAAELESAGYELDDFDCACEGQIGEYLVFTDWETGQPGMWQYVDAVLQDTTGRGGGWGWGDVHAPNKLWVSVGTLRIAAGLGNPAGNKIWINRVSYWYKHSGVLAGSSSLRCYHDAGNEYDTWPNSLVWAYATKTYSPPLESTYNLFEVVKILGVGSSGNAVFIDDISIDFDATT